MESEIEIKSKDLEKNRHREKVRPKGRLNDHIINKSDKEWERKT